MANIDSKDSVFANAADAVSDFETIFDDEDSIIEMVVGFGENGESLIGRDPEEEFTTDNSDGKVDMEDSSPSTAQNFGPDAETGKGIGESLDLDELFAEADDGSKDKIEGDSEFGKEIHNKLTDGQVSGSQTDSTNKSNILEEPVETSEKQFHNESSLDLDELFEADEQTDKTNKSNILEEPVETDWKDFHNESSLDLDELFEADEQTDKTNKSNILEEPVETDWKDFHNESSEIDLDEMFGYDEGCDPITDASRIKVCPKCGCKECKCGGTDNKSKAISQTDKTNKSNMLDEPVETDWKDFHNEGAELDALFESLGLNEGDEQTDETNKSDMLEEPVETDEKDFHNEGADLDALFEALEDEAEHDEFDDSFEGMKLGSHIGEAADDVDYAEDELIKVADEKDGKAVSLNYKPGEDDAIIDKVIKNN